MGEIVNVYISERDKNYMKLCKNSNEKRQYFYTKKSRKEIGFLNEDENIFYVNYDYKKDNYIKKLVREIKKDYNVEKESEYMNLSLPSGNGKLYI